MEIRGWAGGNDDRELRAKTQLKSIVREKNKISRRPGPVKDVQRPKSVLEYMGQAH